MNQIEEEKKTPPQGIKAWCLLCSPAQKIRVNLVQGTFGTFEIIGPHLHKNSVFTYGNIVPMHLHPELLAFSEEELVLATLQGRVWAAE